MMMVLDKTPKFIRKETNFLRPLENAPGNVEQKTKLLPQL